MMLFDTVQNEALTNSSVQWFKGKCKLVFCPYTSSGGGGSSWRPGSGGEAVEQENPADVAWPSGICSMFTWEVF